MDGDRILAAVAARVVDEGADVDDVRSAFAVIVGGGGRAAVCEDLGMPLDAVAG
jgi:hypothetical protein